MARMSDYNTSSRGGWCLIKKVMVEFNDCKKLSIASVPFEQGVSSTKCDFVRLDLISIECHSGANFTARPIVAYPVVNLHLRSSKFITISYFEKLMERTSHEESDYHCLQRP